MNYLERAADDAGYPNLDFEDMYQKGLACFQWGLPRPLVRQAFKYACAGWTERDRPILMWHVRAFVYGLSGRCDGGIRKRLAPEDYQWPVPPDPSWELVVCTYPDGTCELDLVHPVSGRFWSEDNGFFELPTEKRTLMNPMWFKSMGFDVMHMQPALQVRIGDPKRPHLKLV
ncbi:TPA: hypothetical protein ACNV18_001764 [Pseudomonas putida]|jgi:hypothetical protein|uniref:Uncharacterized protein n=3 Tax=Pseudomonas TaxID=286 RepID=A0A2A3M289_PSEDL|nr:MULTISPECIES: hypothetical protein [Pseudomonas]MCT8191704.1 hypothetical protein [Pseudomonas monteilii]TXG99574.1 MAG: hypothetical protein E6R08_01910 [Nevskiaceae bacterium]AGZ38219.1 hypothetical protein PVLB_27412 [Pseudomonas sp. VLB120]EKT4481323.1 hypothetical protein [Pseudomonas putida]MBA6061022.1 hypothetical protein [Pseudomonas juntendi]